MTWKEHWQEWAPATVIVLIYAGLLLLHSLIINAGWLK